MINRTRSDLIKHIKNLLNTNNVNNKTWIINRNDLVAILEVLETEPEYESVLSWFKQLSGLESPYIQDHILFIQHKLNSVNNKNS